MEGGGRYDDFGAILAHGGLDRHGQRWLDRLEAVTASDVESALAAQPGRYSLEKLMVFLSPAAGGYLEEMARSSRDLTLQRFGRTMRLYVPLYLSNYCVNGCFYCGFNRNTSAPRAPPYGRGGCSRGGYFGRGRFQGYPAGQQ